MSIQLLSILGFGLLFTWWLFAREVEKDMAEPYVDTFAMTINFILLLFMVILTVGYLVIIVLSILGVI